MTRNALAYFWTVKIVFIDSNLRPSTRNKTKRDGWPTCFVWRTRRFWANTARFVINQRMVTDRQRWLSEFTAVKPTHFETMPFFFHFLLNSFIRLNKFKHKFARNSASHRSKCVQPIRAKINQTNHARKAITTRGNRFQKQIESFRFMCGENITRG